jgi:pyruvate ferredoxin oxidoreductase gamma subunit
MLEGYIEVCLHGRGDQEIVTTSALPSRSLLLEGRYPLSVPLYSSQRRGAPAIMALGLCNDKLNLRSWVHSPEYVVALDDSLLGIVNATQEVPGAGSILFNIVQPSQHQLVLARTLQVGRGGC